MELKKKEFSADYYNGYYKGSKEYRYHYSKLPYVDMWDRAVSICGKDVFEIGCGSGQFANMVVDAGKNYQGFDISEEAVKIADSLGLKCQFYVNDFKRFVKYPSEFDTYIAFEILEHVDDDTGLLMRIPDRKFTIFTVPDFDYKSHVRLFNTETEIIERYGDIIDLISIDKFDKWFLCYGHRKVSKR